MNETLIQNRPPSPPAPLPLAGEGSCETATKFSAFLSVLLLAASISTAAEDANSAATLSWHSDLRDGLRQATVDRKPVLVRVGSDFCPWCRKLETEMEKADVQTELLRWTLVAIDAERSPDDAAQLAVGPVPSLRLLTPSGRRVASHDGFLEADKLVAWLQEHYEEAKAAPDDALLATGKPEAVEVVRLVRQFGQRDPLLREAAIRRLLPHPDAAAAVVKAFREGNLAERLAALELLGPWHAPVEDLDPWRPETITEERLAALQSWTAEVDAGQLARPETLSPEQLSEARRNIDHMLAGTPDEASAIAERLARLGSPLLAEVYARIREASTDEDRQRLLALRYRLVAGDTLVLRWPGGLERLAATEPAVRQKAVAELAGIARPEDQRLLLELFSDPDAMVREISLRGLQNLGGREASAALVELLKDPEPNVRAAVLKQLAEEPPQAMVAEVAQYLKTESDADLVVHGIRFLRAAGGKEAVRSLKSLLKHESWQVRAEAAEAIGQAIDSGYSTDPFGPRFGEPNSETADTYVALIELLDDNDAFVVSRAVAAMEGADMAVAVDPLAKAARQHPELAAKIMDILARGEHMRIPAVPHFRKLVRHDDPKIRAAAIGGLVGAVPGEMEEELVAGLKDQAGEVRIAAAGAVFQILEQQRSPAADKLAGVPATLLRSRIVSSSGEPAEAKPEPPDEPEAGSESAQEEEKPDPSATNAWDDWLATYYSEKKHPKGLDPLVPLLDRMLTADLAEQRAAAAIALVPLGRKDQALTCLRQAVEQEKRLLASAGAVLPWLVWPDRVALFDHLRPFAASGGDLAVLVHALVEVPDRRAAGPFWRLLADPNLDDSSAAALYTGLQMAYFGRRYYDLSDARPSAVKAFARDAKARVAEGSQWQRSAALALLAAADADEAAAAARSIVEDSSVDPALRQDAFHVALATQPPEEAAKRAIDALSNGPESWRKLALVYLVEGRSRLGAVGGQFDIQTPMMDVFTRGDGVDLGPPAGLKLEHVRPLVDDPEPRTAACAGYLAALFGQRDGLDNLLSYWRSNREEHDTVNRLVYRAVAALNAAEYLPVLEEIYGELDEHEMSQFYWTIRVMTGREALQLRSRIRDEVGMEKLR